MTMNVSNGPRAKNWCFTLNNYTEEDVNRLSSIETSVEYIIFGKEIGEQGTPHLQGYVCFRSRKRLNQVIQLLGQCHCTVTRFIGASIDYCKKDGDFTELGTPPKDRGTRSDLEEFKNAVKEGLRNNKDIREQFSDVVAKYPRFVADYVRDHRPKVCVEAHPLREWQQTLNTYLNGPVHKREIVFVVDRVGNSGKSWFARYYQDNHDACQIIVPSKKSDMAYVLDDNARVVIFDCPRSKQGEYVQYDFLEEVKNGYVFSPKYESRIKAFKQPHVVVLMNERPCEEKLSSDRYKIVTLT